MDSTEMPLNLEFTLKSETLASITLCCFLYLQHNLCLIIVSFVAAKFSITLTYQLFFPYILYTRNFSRYVNFTDFVVSRDAVKIYSMKILLSHYLRVVSIGFVVLTRV